MKEKGFFNIWVPALAGMTIISSLLFSSCSYSANQDDLAKLLAFKDKQQTAHHLDLSNADLRSFPFDSNKVDLQQANLSHSNLAGVDLSKMNLGGADLSYANLSNAKLNEVNLTDANLSHANLNGTELQQSDLSRTNLSYANLTSANLQQAILTKANLTCANLNQADLSKSNFAEATISGVTLINTMTADIVGYDSVTERSVNCGS